MSSFLFFLLEMVKDSLKNSSLNSLAVLPVLGLLKPKH